MPETDRLGLLSTAIPELYFDVIGRLIPGFLVIVSVRYLCALTTAESIIGAYMAGLLLDPLGYLVVNSTVCTWGLRMIQCDRLQDIWADIGTEMNESVGSMLKKRMAELLFFRTCCLWLTLLVAFQLFTRPSAPTFPLVVELITAFISGVGFIVQYRAICHTLKPRRARSDAR